MLISKYSIIDCWVNIDSLLLCLTLDVEPFITLQTWTLDRGGEGSACGWTGATQHSSKACPHQTLDSTSTNKANPQQLFQFIFPALITNSFSQKELHPVLPPTVLCLKSSMCSDQWHGQPSFLWGLEFIVVIINAINNLVLDEPSLPLVPFSR